MTQRPRRSVEERFWSFAQVCEHGYECRDCCWIWSGTCVGHMGYGQLFIGIIGGKKRYKGAHVVSWRIHNGMQVLTKGEQILHTVCDNPPCVNPHHLSRGTHLLNMADMREKGRQNKLKGSRHIATHLSEADVAMLRELYASGGWSQRSLAAYYGITQPTTQKILKGQAWVHMQDRLQLTINAILSSRTARILSDEDVDEIRELLMSGWTHKAIAAEFGCNKNTISEISVGHTHR